MKSVSLAAFTGIVLLSPSLAHSNQSEEWEYLLVFPMIWTPSITGTSGTSW